MLEVFEPRVTLPTAAYCDIGQFYAKLRAISNAISTFIFKLYFKLILINDRTIYNKYGAVQSRRKLHS